MANPSSQTRKDESRPGSTESASTAEHARNLGSSAADRAKEMAASAAQSASNLGHKAQEKASDLAASASQRAHEATTSAGSTMQGFAHTLRENLPHEGMMGRASSTLADTLESSGRYLQEEGLSGMVEDLTGIIRRNPIPAVLVGIGIGYLLARSLRS